MAEIDPHELALARSLELHREVARRLIEQPELIERALERLAQWRLEDRLATYWIERWEAWLQLPPNELAARLTDPTEEAQSMRQSTPFAGVVGPRERWHIWRETREAREAQR